jgi:hypothetical protein
LRSGKSFTLRYSRWTPPSRGIRCRYARSFAVDESAKAFAGWQRGEGAGDGGRSAGDQT